MVMRVEFGLVRLMGCSFKDRLEWERGREGTVSLLDFRPSGGESLISVGGKACSLSLGWGVWIQECAAQGLDLWRRLAAKMD